nr:IMV membrane protein [Wadden Sea poxvirus]
MNRLYAAIFGVFISSDDDDFTNFINVVKSVISDEPIINDKKYNNYKTWLFVLIFLLLILILYILYLKLIQKN